MSLSNPWKLRTYLYLLAIGILLPGVALVCWNAYSQFRHAERTAERDSYDLASVTADNTALFLAEAEQLLHALASRIQSRPDPQGACDPIFGEFKTLFPRFANLSQSSPQGYLICSTRSQRNEKNTYVGNTEWFKLVYGQEKFIVAPPYTGVVTGRMVSVLALPIRDATGKVTGALQLPVDLANFKLLAGIGKLPASTTLSILDSHGTLIARSQAPEQFVGRNLRGVKAVEDLLRIRDGTAKSVSSEGVERIYGFRPVPGTDWIVSAGVATSEALKESRAAAKNNVLLGAIGFLFAAAIAFLVSRKIALPIMKMQETAAKIASGDYGQRAAVEGPREIADVAHQFNAMLNAIEHSRLVQTEREAQIHHLAFYDVLTGLPNRRVLVQEIEQHLNVSGQAERIGAVIYIDLDHFKDVNDAYGHQAGDRFLKEVADRIRAILTGGDTLARIGGDEFVYVAANVGTNQEAAAAAALKLGQQIQAVLQQPGGTVGYGSSTSASLGITLFPKVGDTSEILLHEADIAMYHVKKSGRSRVALFESSMRSQLTARIAMEVDLHSALKEGQFQLYIQSQVDHAGTVTGAEALLRWYHPRQEMISPAIFIPVAEESNLIVQIGNWVLREGCKAQVAAQIQYPRLPLSINVSPRQFRHPDFVENVREAIDQARADPSLLILEVTEGLLIDDVEGTIERMNELAKSGIRFSIDDFGTGYSSLAYLQRLPLYELKIDMSFIKDIPNDSNSTAIVQSIIGVAEHLGLHVVAEGVETRAQVAFLTASGCNALQGYLFARPIPLHEWLKKPVSSPAPNLG